MFFMPRCGAFLGIDPGSKRERTRARYGCVSMSIANWLWFSFAVFWIVSHSNGSLRGHPQWEEAALRSAYAARSAYAVSACTLEIGSATASAT
jgi:hypothetical protein